MEITKEESTSIIIADIKGAHLEQDTEKLLLERFTPFEEQAKIWLEKAKTINVTSVGQTKEMMDAREARLQIRQIRIGVDKTHKLLKEDILKKGRVLDKIKNKLTELIEPVEEHLQAQEDFIKIKEQEEKQKLINERKELLRPYLDEIILNSIPLSDLTDDAFKNVLAQQKFAYEARIEAERKAIEQQELDRIAREREENRIRQENEKLRIENEKKERKLQKERDERKRLENEAREREEKEERERKEKQAAERRLKRAPDKVRLQNFAERIMSLHMEFSGKQMNDEEATIFHQRALKGLNDIATQLKVNAEKL